jgi:hypothetical protein
VPIHPAASMLASMFTAPRSIGRRSRVRASSCACPRQNGSGGAASSTGVLSRDVRIILRRRLKPSNKAVLPAEWLRAHNTVPARPLPRPLWRFGAPIHCRHCTWHGWDRSCNSEACMSSGRSGRSRAGCASGVVANGAERKWAAGMTGSALAISVHVGAQLDCRVPLLGTQVAFIGE